MAVEVGERKGEVGPTDDDDEDSTVEMGGLVASKQPVGQGM